MPQILVIDDVDAARTTICRMLERAGYDVLEACNGKEGLKMFEKYAPEVVVSDILMPEMEGIETIRALRKRNPELPIIAITASIDTPYLEMAMKFGAICGLYKPFKSAELLEAVQKALLLVEA